jgi:hypothetical protein
MNVVLPRSLELVTVVVEARADLEAESDGGSIKGATALVLALKNKYAAHCRLSRSERRELYDDSTIWITAPPSRY